MAKIDHLVDVFLEAVPFSENYHQLPDPERALVDALLLDQVNTLVPMQQQLQWRDIDVPQSDYDDILAHVNGILMQGLETPPGTELVLADASAVFWLPTQTGHRILFFARLLDQATGMTRPWEFFVSHNGARYQARMGLAYECTPA